MRFKKLIVCFVLFSLAICFVYALFYIAGYFGESFFVLSNRGMVEHIIGGSLVSAGWDIAVWVGAVSVVIAWLFYGLVSRRTGGIYQVLGGFVLFGLAGWVCLVVFGVISGVSLILVSVLLIVLGTNFSRFFFDVFRIDLFLRLLFGVFLIVLFIEVAALVLFSFPFALNFSYSAAGLHWSIVELNFSNLAYPFLPYLYLLFVLLGVVGFAVKAAPARWFNNKISGQRFTALVGCLRGSFELDGDGGFDFLRGRFVLAVAVLIGVVVSCLFVLFTVLPWANPTHMLVSVDSPDYYQWIVHMRSLDFNGAMSFAFANDRALFLVLAYTLSFFVSPLIVIQYIAALLIVLFGVVSFLVLRLFCSIRAVWVFGVLLVPFSFQALGLIYSGYFANMLALILVFVYVVLFFRLLERWSNLGFFGLLGVSILVLFSHSWTWFIFALSLAMFSFLEWRRAVDDKALLPRFKVKATFVGATVVIGLLCDFIRKALSPVSSSASVLVTAQSSLSFPNAAFLLNGLRESVDFVLGGVYANGLLIFLCFIGFLVLLRFRSEVSSFLVSWVFVGCVSILFAAQNFVFDRFLFLMPWVVLSSLGLFFIVRFVGCRLGDSRSWRFGIVLVVLFFVFLVLLNGSLRYLFNINIW